RDYWVMLGVSALFTLIWLQRSRRIGRLAGALLLCGFICWVGILYQFPSVTFW
ncbi:calcium/sodium antiporter, partial [Erwinia amylovora]|nr:calcium/sodium antiporter [Erwinia amylovora]